MGLPIFARRDEEEVHDFISPWVELNFGLWSLFAAATILLTCRIWIKIVRRYGLWYDDYILVVSWIVLLVTDSLIIHEFATGYILENSSQKWDDRMHILINISSCGVLIGQSLTKTAFAVTLLRLSKRWQKNFLWFCIITMNAYMVAKVILQWARTCGSKSTYVYYRLNVCLDKGFRDDFKEGGNIYNIVMDFIFALFPWLLIRGVDMRKYEKAGLCAVMSLGMLVAIVSAIRVSWKDEGNDRDRYYIYRNGLSQVWYSSEVTGTIIVQCIPILRPVLRDVHNSLASKKLSSTGDRRSTTTVPSRWSGGPRRGSSLGTTFELQPHELRKKETGEIVLAEIGEETEDERRPQQQWQQSRGREEYEYERNQEPWMVTSSTQRRFPTRPESLQSHDFEQGFPTMRDDALMVDEPWSPPRSAMGTRRTSISTTESDMSLVEVVDWDNEAYDLGVRKSLSPVPRERIP